LGRRDLRLEPVDLSDLTNSTLQTLMHQIAVEHVEVNVGQLPVIVADRTSMEQIVGNLLDNAIKYLEPGRRGVIDITAEERGNQTVVSVRDNGRGIAGDDLPKVFAPFRRAGKQGVPGEGMGLPYVQTLVHRHGGRIWLESELGTGSTFSFSIPNPRAKGVIGERSA